jgi:hypothetical protein
MPKVPMMQHPLPPEQSAGPEHLSMVMVPLHVIDMSWQRPVFDNGLKQQLCPLEHGTPGHLPAAGAPSGFVASERVDASDPESASARAGDDDELHPDAIAKVRLAIKTNEVFIMKSTLH